MGSKNRTPRKRRKVSVRNSVPTVKVTQKKREHPKYGTSKLEDDFAHDFLDRLGLKYIRQFEAKDIGRFYDFAVECPNGNGVNGGSKFILIEVDGDYWHGNPETLGEGKERNRMQVRNQWVDRQKDEWALMNGIPIMRVWEKDIRENQGEVMKRLRERFYLEEEKNMKLAEKNKRHKNVIK